METQKNYRRNVAAFIVNAEGKILACERSDYAGAWQAPQGGIDGDETPQQALFRELREEIGTDDAEILAQYEGSICYDWPPELYRDGYHGQQQYYFLVRLREGAVIDLNASGHREFSSCEWVSAEEFRRRLSGFKKEAYCRALDSFLKVRPGAIA